MKLDRWLHGPDLWELEHSSLMSYLLRRLLIWLYNFIFSRTGTSKPNRQFDPLRKYPVTLPDNQDCCHDSWLVKALEITERCEFIQTFLPFQIFACRTRQLSKIVAPTDYPTVHFQNYLEVVFYILFNWFITVTFRYIKYKFDYEVSFLVPVICSWIMRTNVLLCGSAIVWLWVYMMKVILETTSCALNLISTLLFL